MKLYSFPPSTNARKIHAIAFHLNLPLDVEIVNLPEGDQRKPEFLAINPTGRIPALQDGDFILWESNAIMQYLASQVETSLWPENAKLKTDISRWQCWQLAHWYKGCFNLTYERVVKPMFNMGEPDPQVIEQALASFHREAAVLNAHLTQHDYLVNDQLTLADFSVAMDLANAEAAQMPLENYPAIGTWLARMEALPAWQQTAPQMMAQ